MKTKVSLNLARLITPAKIEKAKQIVTAITGNVNFTTPIPSLATVTAAISALETAFNNAQDGGKSKTAVMHEKEKVLDDVLTRLGHYVEDTSLGVESIILSSGMDVKNSNTPVGVLPAPVNLEAITGSASGEIHLRWKSEINAASYIIQMAIFPANVIGPPVVWTQISVVTKAKFIAKSLSAGTRYGFRVAVVGSAGISAWSDIATATAI